MLTIFYYKETMNDTMSIIINNNKPTKLEHKDGFSIIYHNDVLVGINIFDVSKKFQLENGYIYANSTLLKKIYEITKMDLSIYNNPSFVVGRIESIAPIKNSHLTHCQVFNGYDNTSVVCGAKNVTVGAKVVLANAGAALPSGLILKPSKMFEIESNGMLCSKNELFNTQEPSSGILILDDKYQVGQPYLDLYKNFKRK